MGTMSYRDCRGTAFETAMRDTARNKGPARVTSMGDCREGCKLGGTADAWSVIEGRETTAGVFLSLGRLCNVCNLTLYIDHIASNVSRQYELNETVSDASASFMDWRETHMYSRERSAKAEMLELQRFASHGAMKCRKRVLAFPS